jgi:hypothetical protein
MLGVRVIVGTAVTVQTFTKQLLNTLCANRVAEWAVRV